jgi:hypothetical protein
MYHNLASHIWTTLPPSVLFRVIVTTLAWRIEAPLVILQTDWPNLLLLLEVVLIFPFGGDPARGFCHWPNGVCERLHGTDDLVVGINDKGGASVGDVY